MKRQHQRRRHARRAAALAAQRGSHRQTGRAGCANGPLPGGGTQLTDAHPVLHGPAHAVLAGASTTRRWPSRRGTPCWPGPWRTWCRGWKGRLRGVPLPLVSGLEITFPLVFNEGGATSDVWRPIITGVFGVPSTLIKDRTGAPLGDAMLAGVAVRGLSRLQRREGTRPVHGTPRARRPQSPDSPGILRPVQEHLLPRPGRLKSLPSLLRRTSS
jgi:hypothetical protein